MVTISLDQYGWLCVGVGSFGTAAFILLVLVLALISERNS